MRISAVSVLLGPALLTLTASCVWPQPEAAGPQPSPAAAVAAPGPVSLTSPPSPPAVVAAEPSAPTIASIGPAPPAREIEIVPVPFLWLRMLGQPAPAGRLLLNNFSFEPTRVQVVPVSGPACALADPGATVEFVLPSNGTRIIPAPPGIDICWRRQLVAGETKEIPVTGPWTAWSRAYTGPGRFLDAVVLTPPTPPTVVATVEKAPPSSGPTALQNYPPLEK